MEFKIKCGVRLDELTVIGIDVDDDKSFHFVMDDSKFIRAYRQHVLPATICNATQREEVLLPSEAFSSGACDENHGNEVNPVKGVTEPRDLNFDDICGAKVIRLEDMTGWTRLNQPCKLIFCQHDNLCDILL
ncbi:hypothetical protein ACHQM5_007532 [Ranunculus cassubicifolius]